MLRRERVAPGSDDDGPELRLRLVIRGVEDGIYGGMSDPSTGETTPFTYWLEEHGPSSEHVAHVEH